MNRFEIPPGDCWNRDYFEQYTTLYERPDFIKLIIAAYEEASIKATRSARHAVSSGEDSEWLKAIWDEAVAKTLESVLGCLAGDHDQEPITARDSIDLPGRPNFK